LLSGAFRDFDSVDYTLPQPAQKWLLQCAAATDLLAAVPSIELTIGASLTPLRLFYVGQIGVDEHLLRLFDGESASEETLLRKKLLVTEREAEVLLWIARGKSNRDIAEILNLSPRTVNKHLEQIYSKLGVENRASAAALAVRAIGIQ
jgi:DNA-binding CsgD family transcriptional regulator